MLALFAFYETSLHIKQPKKHENSFAYCLTFLNAWNIIEASKSKAQPMNTAKNKFSTPAYRRTRAAYLGNL